MSDPAAARYFVIQIMRVAGVALTIYAILVLRDVAPWPGGLAREIAYALLVIGLTDAFLVPQLLARRWRSPPR